MIIKYDNADSKFIEKSAHIEVLVNGDEWFYFPYWMKKISNGVFEQVPFDKLPEDLLKQLEERRKNP